MTQKELASKIARHPKIAGALTGAMLLLAQAGAAAAQFAVVNPGP